MKIKRYLKQNILFLLAVILFYLKLKKKKIDGRWKNRKWLVRPINLCRKEKGEFHNLFQEVKEDDKMFFKYTRMNLFHFKKLLRILQPFLSKKTTRAISAEERLVVLLRYLSTENSTSSLAFSFRMGQSTVRKIIKEASVTLARTLRPAYLACPRDDQWKNIVKGYWKRWNMPNCFGAIDGKHILLRCPPNSGSLFFNYKKQFSIVLLAVSDDLYKFSLVDIGAYGGNSDGGIFENCNIGKMLINNQLNLPTYLARLPNSNVMLPGYFIADSAFPLSNRLMKPYSASNLSEEQKIYNYRISRARRTVESAFGIFANRWRIFHTPICVLPTTADSLIAAAVCLHNYVMHEEKNDNIKNYSQRIIEPFEEENDIWIEQSELYDRTVTTATRQRDILKNYFTSNGRVEFQEDYIHRGEFAEYI